MELERYSDTPIMRPDPTSDWECTHLTYSLGPVSNRLWSARALSDRRSAHGQRPAGGLPR
jgi:hypothetical protein